MARHTECEAKSVFCNNGATIHISKAAFLGSNKSREAPRVFFRWDVSVICLTVVL